MVHTGVVILLFGIAIALFSSMRQGLGEAGCVGAIIGFIITGVGVLILVCCYVASFFGGN